MPSAITKRAVVYEIRGKTIHLRLIRCEIWGMEILRSMRTYLSKLEIIYAWTDNVDSVKN